VCLLGQSHEVHPFDQVQEVCLLGQSHKVCLLDKPHEVRQQRRPMTFVDVVDARADEA